MACPTCGNTMTMLCIDIGSGTYYHCDRCGTVRIARFSDMEDIVPKLVERCLDFFSVAEIGPVGEMLWAKLGIAESIHPPADRPTHTGGP